MSSQSATHWRCGFAEIGRPLPVPDLGHILKVLADVVEMLIELFAEHLDCIRSLHAKPRRLALGSIGARILINWLCFQTVLQFNEVHDS
jgi:hypothetical protein